jgi:LysM repeat protein
LSTPESRIPRPAGQQQKAPSMLPGITATTSRTGTDALLSPNPSTPVMYVTLSRPGQETQNLEVLPLRFEYVSSVTEADKLEIEVADPGYLLIDNPLLLEDLKTEVTFRFGYAETATMSEPVTLLFWRQKPNFSGAGVTTTLTAFDKGILLTLPVPPKTYSKKDGFTINELVGFIKDEVNELWGQHLEVEFEGHEFQGRRFRIKKPTGTWMEFLYWLRDYARSSTTDAPVEIFVENDVLYFRPARTVAQPIAYYVYHSPVPGAGLLSFEPEVELRPTRSKAEGVDQESGEPVSSDGANDQGHSRPVQMRGINFVTGEVSRPVGSTGDPKGANSLPRIDQKQHTYRATDTLASIAARYDSTVQAIAQANGIADPANPQLTPGQVLTVPVFNITDPGVTTEESRAHAALTYLEEESRAVKARAMVIGHPRLKAGWPIAVGNVGVKWSGLWYIVEVTHTIDGDGYECELNLCRDGVPITEGMEETTGSQSGRDGWEVVDPAEQQGQRQTTGGDRSINFVTGEVRR